MNLNTIGQNIRKYRLAKKLTQQELAEKSCLSTNYISSIERGEKIPALDTFIIIVNTLGVSSDMILTDVVNVGYTVKYSLLTDKISKLSEKDRDNIFAVIETMIAYSKQIKP